MRPSGEQRMALAHRLKSLRLGRWPGRRITQADLAAALEVSGPSISSWENGHAPPPLERLADYATFFATERSLIQEPYRVLGERQLNKSERASRDDLLAELTELYESADGPVAGDSDMGRGLWHFVDGGDVVIVCAQLPQPYREGIRYADPASPDYVELYSYADLDSLIELFGHVRASNPTSTVSFKLAPDLVQDDYKTHLVLVGGVDWNFVTKSALRRLNAPVRQIDRPEDADLGGFEVLGTREKYVPVFDQETGELSEDVAMFFRAPNPYDPARTITICNGSYSRGVYGAVRALTDFRVRKRNEDYVASRFGSGERFSILSKVIIANGQPISPEWSSADLRLYEWPPL